MRRQQRAGPGPGQESVWDYPRPPRVERSSRRGEVVEPQHGDLDGGWVTADVVGPFKGAPDTSGW